MAELRWILLLVGVVFLAVLAAWEMRRSRQARRELSEPSGSAHGEPELGRLPEEFAARSRPAGAAGMGRTPGMAPPIVELPPLGEPDAAAAAVAVDADVDADVGRHVDDTADTVEVGATAEAELQPQAELGPLDPEIEPPAATAAAQPDGAVEPPRPADPASPRVDWPPEGERQIIALRITAASEQRLSGRTTRQALAACGFVHGRYGIFHQPGADGRALLSCASLSKPGIFDPAAMDFQRFAGLSLFAVLPGPLPAEAALDRLIQIGGELAQRLQARLQDEQGRVLDELRIEDLRDSVRQSSARTLGAEPAA